MKNMLIIGIVIVVAFMMVRLLTPQDKWVCEKGKWVAQGNPSTEKPEGVCQNLFR